MNQNKVSAGSGRAEHLLKALAGAAVALAPVHGLVAVNEGVVAGPRVPPVGARHTVLPQQVPAQRLGVLHPLQQPRSRRERHYLS